MGMINRTCCNKSFKGFIKLSRQEKNERYFSKVLPSTVNEIFGFLLPLGKAKFEGVLMNTMYANYQTF